MTGYPQRYECDVVLTDGGTVHVRPIRPDDDGRLAELAERMSPRSLYYRFLSPAPRLTPERIHHFTHVDYDTRMALVATLGDEIVAVARYDRAGERSQEAEVAFAVDDAHQGRGIGTVLLEHLAAVGREQGIRRFTADTLGENRRMLGVFHDAGWEVEKHLDAGVFSLNFPIEETPRATEAMYERERVAEAASMARLLHPASVAVVGASRTPGTIGHQLLLNVLRGDFAGPVYPVNPRASEIAGVPTHASVPQIPGPVDLAVVAVPAADAAEVVEDCAAAHVKGLVVVSAGFSESGAEGREAERRLVHLARANGMRMIGPNCMGVVNTDHEVRLDATFSPHTPRPGPIGFLSQSGAFGIALLAWANRLRLGVSTFVSVGNKADVSGNDLLQYWESDDATGVVLLYLESFGNPRKFARIARRVSATKPIVAVKGGRTRAGTRAAESHTAAAASPDVAVDALFHQAGVVRVDTVGAMFDAAQLLAYQPLPRGRRVAIVGNGGGPGILAADACEQAGLEVPELGEATRAELAGLLHSGAATGNPVDMVASAGADHYRATLDAVLADESVDAVVVQFTPPMVTSADEVAAAVVEAARGSDKPVAAVFLATEEVPEAARAEPGSEVPVFHTPEDAVHAVAKAVGYAEWRRRPRGEIPELPDLHPEAARTTAATWLADRPDGGWVDPGTAGALLEAFGIPAVGTAWVDDDEAAVAAAEQLGYPVALKAAGTHLVHKSDVGGVHLDLGDAEGVRRAYAALDLALGDSMAGAVVQPMVGGVETIVGVTQDPSFGPLVMFGLGGVTTELLADRSFRILPITDVDAAALVRSIRGAPLLFGYRGTPEADVVALEALLVRVGRLADEVPELAEMDLNPVMVGPDGARAVDVKIRLAPPAVSEPRIRRLR